MLLNNAGIGLRGASWSGLDNWKQIFDVNVFGTMQMTQAFIPLLVAANSNSVNTQWSSRIIQIGSIAAMGPTPFYSAYNASKAAMLHYGNTLRVELAPFGVKVITVSILQFSLRVGVS